MKKTIKKVLKPFFKPIIIRFNNLNYKIEEINNYIENNNKKTELIQNELNEISNELKKKENEIQVLNNIVNNQNETMKKEINILKNNNTNSVENIFYYHGGSGNHGCEALIRTICKINDFVSEKSLLYSYRPDEDYKFKLNNIVNYIYPSNLDAEELSGFYKEGTIAFSIGGDNYCDYDYGTKRLSKYNYIFNKNGASTALIGCSIEPDVLEHQEVLNDLERFSLITARESITYEKLIAKGINKNIHLVPDSAFILESIEKKLPKNFILGKTVGINLSDLVQSYDSLAFDNYITLIEYLINNTSYNIALIPHVVQSFNDDLKILKQIYKRFSDTNRICFIEESNCMILKGYISRCSMFIGARTHSTIAAYSSCVPTLVLGYSVKSKGIAKDLFGTYDNYVLSVHDLKSKYDLVDSFKWLDKNKDYIKQHLNDIMPSYTKQCYKLKELINDIREKKEFKFELANKALCSGCEACKNICPMQCIEMYDDEKGCKIPKIDYTKCIHCNKCKKICPINKSYIGTTPIICYAAKSKSKKITKKSSSGGLFTELAIKILEQNGIIYGAAFDDKNNLSHIRIDNSKDLYKLNGSKYLQSEIKDSYKNAKKDLDNNRIVLFSGTPCQIRGLKNFLEKEYINLFCIEVICHGTPSPKVFKEYIDSLEKKEKSKVKKVDFRDKKNGWKNFNIRIEFENGKEIIENIRKNIYMTSFLNNMILRNSCYNCQFKNFKSDSDITLGDYWGIENIHRKKIFLDDTGVSLVIINSQKGLNMFNDIKENILYEETDYNEAKKYNICITDSVKYNNKIDTIWNNEKNIIEKLEEFYEGDEK